MLLGETGRNVAAGMTGGLAYIYEERENFVEERLNHEIVTKQRVHTKVSFITTYVIWSISVVMNDCSALPYMFFVRRIPDGSHLI